MPERVELEKGVEIHKLNAGTVVHVPLVVHLHIPVNGSVGMLVPVCVRQAEKLSVLSEKCEVASPGVNAHRLDLYSGFGNFAQGDDYLVVEGGKVPELVTSERNHRMFESGKLLHGQLYSVICGKDGPSAGSAEVNCKIIFVSH